MKLYRACPYCKTALNINDKDIGGTQIHYIRCGDSCPYQFEVWVRRPQELNSTSHLRPLPKPEAVCYAIVLADNSYRIYIYSHRAAVWDIRPRYGGSLRILDVEQTISPEIVEDPEQLLLKVKLWLTFQ